MLTEKTEKAILAEVRRITGEAGSAFGQQEAGLQEAIEKDTVTYWLQWNALSYAYAKRLLNEWDSILNGITRMFKKEGHTVDEVLERLRGYRDGMVENILQTDQSSKSTSVMSNALTDEGIQVLRDVVGANILNPNSLKAILIACGVDNG